MKAVKTIALTTAVLVFLVALGSFALSYHNLRQMAIDNGITGNLAYVWPLLIDFSLIVFSLSVVNAYLQSESTFKQWSLVGVYTVATISFNVMHAPDNLQSQIVAAIAPVSLFFSFELLMNQLKTSVKKHGLTLNIEQLQKRLDTKQNEFNNLVDTKGQQLDTLTAKVEQQQRKLEQLKQAESVLTTDKNSSIEQARLAKLEQDSNDKQQRLDTLLNILIVNPEESVTALAEQLTVSRTTVYNDLKELEQAGLIHKNGNGIKVSK